jgi:hypothetical protein
MTVLTKSMKVHKDEYEIMKKMRGLKKDSTELINLKNELKNIKSRESYKIEQQYLGFTFYVKSFSGKF